MAIVWTEATIPLASGYPMPQQAESAAGFSIRTRAYFDDAVAQTKAAIYMPGSGTATPPSETHALIVALCAAGYHVLTAGWDIEPYSPYRYGYHSTSNPLVLANWIRSAWSLQSLLWYNNVIGKPAPVVIGSSRGASAAVAWAAGYCTGGQAFSIKGILANAATIGGLGGYVWNDVMRNVNRMASSMIGLLDNKPYPIVLSYGGADDYAPPDYQRRVQLAIPDNSAVYMVTPGPAFGHSWFTDPSGTPLAVMWADQLWAGSAITKADGVTPAVSGA